jgi:hypothetical protein
MIKKVITPLVVGTRVEGKVISWIFEYYPSELVILDGFRDTEARNLIRVACMRKIATA